MSDQSPDQPLSDPRRKRILYRATHRGTKESDAIVGGFFREAVHTLPDARLADAEEFLELPDLDLLDWIMGRKPVPERLKGSMLEDVMAWHDHRMKRG